VYWITRRPPADHILPKFSAPHDRLIRPVTKIPSRLTPYPARHTDWGYQNMSLLRGTSIQRKLHFPHITFSASKRTWQCRPWKLAQAAAALNCIREKPGSNLDPKTGYPYWFSSMPPGKWQDSTYNNATNVLFVYARMRAFLLLINNA
jgi:hypothetical protein